MLFFEKFGSLLVRLSTKSSFGCCSEIDSVQWLYYSGETCNCPPMTVLCCTLDVEETLSHLFLTCPFAQVCWIKLNVIFVETDPFMALEEVQNQLQIPFHMEVIILYCWSIWMQRNDYIFKGVPPSSDRCLQNFKKEFILVTHRAKARWKEAMLEWIETLV